MEHYLAHLVLYCIGGWLLPGRVATAWQGVVLLLCPVSICLMADCLTSISPGPCRPPVLLPPTLPLCLLPVLTLSYARLYCL